MAQCTNHGLKVFIVSVPAFHGILLLVSLAGLYLSGRACVRNALVSFCIPNNNQHAAIRTRASISALLII